MSWNVRLGIERGYRVGLLHYVNLIINYWYHCHDYVSLVEVFCFPFPQSPLQISVLFDNPMTSQLTCRLTLIPIPLHHSSLIR